MKTISAAALVLLASSTPGCALAPVRENTAAIGRTNETVSRNTMAVEASTRTASALVPALENVNRLEPSLRSLAGLDPPEHREQVGRFDGVE